MTRTRALWLMIACLLVAAVLRLPDLAAVPPGPHYDEAANGVLAADIGLRGDRPLFISSYTGKEVFFFYTAGGLMRLIGPSVFALRLTSAFLGVMTVAATYWLGRQLLADRRVAVVAAALVAVSFWHLLFSRLGFRAISQPLLQALAVAALFRGLQRREWAWCGVGGLFMGLTAYSYLAARLFPIPLALALLPVLVGRERRRERWGQIALFGGVALVVLAPLLVFFANHPDAFWVRIEQVAPAGAEAGVLDSYLRSLGMFFLVGDPYVRFNLPGRALFDWFWGGLLVVGGGVALWRWRRWWYDWQKAAVALLLLVPFFMILPTALATGEIVPSNLRAIGLIPFIFYLPALGLVTLLEHLADLFRRPGAILTDFLQYLRLLEKYEVNYAFVVLLVLLLGGARTGRAYFQEWAGRSDLFYASDADLADVADFLDETGDDPGTIYVASPHYRHPTLAFLSERYDAVKWLPESKALALPPAGSALYVFPRNSPAPAWAREIFSGTTRIEGPLGPDGRHTFIAFETDAAPPLAIPNETTANFANVVTLLGYVVGQPPAGGPLPLTLYWAVTGTPPGNVQPFVHLEDGWGHRWSQVETAAYPAAQWAVGERIVQRVEVPVPPGTPPGAYRLRLGLFDPDTGRRLSRLDEEGRYAGDAFVVDAVPVPAGGVPDEMLTPPHGSLRLARPGLRFLGYERGGTTVAQGETMPLAVWWWAREAQPDLTTRLVLVRPDGTGVILHDTRPVHGTYPFSSWDPPQFVVDRLDPTVPNDLEPGAYRLELRLLEPGGETAFTAELGPVAVAATERVFTVPQPGYALSATLGGEIELPGYDLARGEERGRFDLTLFWQAVAAPAGDYTVFVHVLAQDGTCCLWQADVMPRQGAYPTGRWLPGEVVADEYAIKLPPNVPAGQYTVEVGLYVAETGRRLQVTQPGAPAGDAVYLRPLQVE